MKVYHGSYLIFYLSDKKFKIKEIIQRIWITAIFVPSCFVAIKVAFSVEIACSCKGKCNASVNYSVFSISADVSFNSVLSDLDF